MASESFKGILLAAAALLLFAAMDACTKYLTADYPVPIVVAMRYWVHLVLMLALFAPTQGTNLILINRKTLVLFRGSCLALLSLFMALALQRMPVAETTAISFSAPLIVALLASKFLQEEMTKLSWFAVIFGFIGVLIIVRPGSGLNSLGVFFAFIVAFIGAIYQMLSRFLATTETASAMLFYSAIIGSLAFGVAFPFFWQDQTPNSFQMFLFLFMGAAGCLGHYLFTLAFRFAPASVLSPTTYVQLVWAILLGWLLFNRVPDLWSFIGMCVIGSSGLLIALKARRHQKK